LTVSYNGLVNGDTPADLTTQFTGWVGTVEYGGGGGGRVLLTQDGGKTWSPRFTSVGNQQHVTGLDFISPTTGWLVGVGHPHITNDGGNTWTQQSVPNQGSLDLLGINFSDANNGWAVGGSELGGGTILHTSDGGTTWTVQVPNGTTVGLQAVQFADASHGWAVGGTVYPFAPGYGVAILHTSDGGTTWTPQDTGTPSGGILNGLDVLDGLTAWAVGRNGGVLHTSDGGITWSSRNLNTSGNDFFGVDFIDSLHGWAVGTNGTIQHTSDGGVTWSSQTSGTTNNLWDVAFTDNLHGWAVGAGGTILHTNNGGSNWILEDSGTTANLTSVEFLAVPRPGSVLTVTTTATAGSPVGSYPITVSGLVDSDYTITFVPGTLRVGYATTATVTSARRAAYGQTVTFTATVTSGAAGTPTGTVDFFDTTTHTDLGSAQLASGVADLSTTALGLGVHAITATYSSDSTFLGSSGSLSRFVEIVSQLPTPYVVTTTADSGFGSLRDAIRLYSE
jgi:photosystem II stability/assembly factor-like uncharacterized protein